MKKEVDGVIVESKSILTALKIIKTVCSTEMLVRLAATSGTVRTI